MKINIFQPGTGGGGSAAGITSGTQVIPTGASFCTITHGLGVTPSRVVQSLRIPVGGYNIFSNVLDSVNSNTFQVSLDASTESNLYKVDYVIFS